MTITLKLCIKVPINPTNTVIYLLKQCTNKTQFLSPNLKFRPFRIISGGQPKYGI